ncbi:MULTISPECIES: biopolymer transporter ExbD [unclassified Variovorax]|uniref:ExbD/TolR family protein n=1 Tax=unclassified Variovorax TaxID=663243 RepID=UPI0025764E32|nr:MULTISPECIES: biopolymer transporter ExbD [unclassified Variovorax]MDM0087214.1 biopolymer transporter ExbD [Variovorax sp. J22G40]MDM0144529.1 biopolymer transporter ExbD [Variovorax sp. J2P1-31]
MAMNLGASASAEPQVMVDINTTPLIDVMLVLLIMLIVTIPIQLHSVNLNMPAPQPRTVAQEPEVVRIHIDADGALNWNDEKLAGLPLLESRLAGIAAQPVQPELHVRPDRAVDYRVVAAVMAAVQRHGLTKIGLVGSEQFL